MPKPDVQDLADQMLEGVEKRYGTLAKRIDEDAARIEKLWLRIDEQNRVLARIEARLAEQEATR